MSGTQSYQGDTTYDPAGVTAQERRQYQRKLKRYRKRQAWEAAQYDEPKTPDIDLGAQVERQLGDYQQQASTAVARGDAAREQMFNTTFDPNNPFSSQALLSRNIGEAHASTSVGFGARGQLYSGAHEAQQGRVAFTGQQQQDQLLRDYLARQEQINSSQAGTLDELQASADDAIFAAAQRAGAADAGTAPPESRLASRPQPKGGRKKPKKPT